MMYRTSDGKTFSSYTAMCDYLISSNSDPEVKAFYRKENENLRRRQRSWYGRLLAFMILPVTLPLCTLLGHPENAIDSVFGKD